MHRSLHLLASAAFLSGCSLLSTVAAISASADDEDYQDVQKALKEADATAPVSDNTTFDKANSTLSGLVSYANHYVERFCTSGKPDFGKGSRCDEVTRLRDQSVDRQVALWKDALQNPKVEFSVVQDELLDAHRKAVYAPKMEMDAWIQALAARKSEHWKNELKARGGKEGYVQTEGQSLCLLVPSAAAKDAELKYVFNSGEKVTIRCQLPKAPKSYRRDAGDYWAVEIKWANHWEGLDLNYDIEEPSANKVVEFEFPAEMVSRRIAQRKAGGMQYAGNWVRARVSYKTRSITGRQLQDDGTLADVWNHESIGEASFFHKFR